MAAKREYRAFLRAVNIGGRFVTMERLRALFAGLGFENVRSYIQSGNVFFETGESKREAIARKIEAHIARELGFECPVFLRTVAELEKTLAIDAFKNVKVLPQTRLAVIPHRSPKGDYELLHATPGEVFVVFHQPDGRPGNPVAYLEKTFGVSATARFHATALKILEAAKKR